MRQGWRHGRQGATARRLRPIGFGACLGTAVLVAIIAAANAEIVFPTIDGSAGSPGGSTPAVPAPAYGNRVFAPPPATSSMTGPGTPSPRAGATVPADGPALPGGSASEGPAAPDAATSRAASDPVPSRTVPDAAPSPAASDRPTAESAEPPAPPKQLSPPLAALRDRVRATLTAYRAQPLSARENTATEVMAACLAFGCRTEVLRADAPREKINGVTLLCWNYPCAAGELLAVCEGHVAPRVGYGFQQRPGQFLATLALSRVPADYPVRVGEDVRTVADLVEHEKKACRATGDMSLRLIGLAYYAKDASWQNDLDEPWSVERLVEQELHQPIAGAPHGGTDRLLALAYAVAQRQKNEQPVDGVFRRARDYLDQLHRHALKMQNADGSWGPGFLAAPGASRDATEQLGATGRIVGWLAVSMSDEELEQSQVVRAVDVLNRLLGNQRYRLGLRGLSTREIDAVMHALRALAAYDQRVFKPADPLPNAPAPAAPTS